MASGGAGGCAPLPGRGRTRAAWALGIFLRIALGSAPAAEAQDFGRDLPAIQAIDFVGNESIDSDHLLAQTMLEFPSLSHPLRPRPRFRRNTFGRELRLVEEYYRRNGFGGVDARLDSVIVLAPRNDVRLRVRIREGPRTRIRELRFLPQPVFSLEELRDIVPFGVGDAYPFSDVVLGRATRAIRLAFLTHGYLAVAVRDSTILSADSSAALIVYRMEPGSQFKVRAVSISGNDHTLPYVIQRELRIQPGQVYSYKLVEDSRQNLYSTGLFRSVAIREEDPDAAASTVDLAVRVVERNNRFIEGSIGFGRRDAFEVNLSAAWGHRNLWGRGQGLRFLTTFAYNIEEGGDRYYNEYRLAYTMPHLWGTRLHFAPSVNFTLDQRQVDVDIQGWQIEAPFLYQFGSYTTAGAGASMAFTETTLPEEEITEDLRETRLVFASATRNASSDLFNPKSGDIRSLSVERAGLGGENYFTRISGSYTRYVPIGRNVLALGLRGGWVEAFGASREEAVATTIGIHGVPFEYLYQAGGSSTVRGFEVAALGSPVTVTQRESGGGTDVEVQTVNVQAGTVLLIGNLELRRPVPWFSRWNLDMALFVDAGNVWEDFGAFLDARFGPRLDRHYTSIADLRWSYGFGIRYPTPFGPIRIDLGVPMKTFGRREWHFAVGHPF